jgi:heme/copper-type cytochrome/quinol oxidase subunit 1
MKCAPGTGATKAIWSGFVELHVGVVAAVLALALWRFRLDRRRLQAASVPVMSALAQWLLLVTTVLAALTGVLEFAGPTAADRWGWLLTSPLLAAPFSQGLLAKLMALLIAGHALAGLRRWLGTGSGNPDSFVVRP